MSGRSLIVLVALAAGLDMLLVGAAALPAATAAFVIVAAAAGLAARAAGADMLLMAERFAALTPGFRMTLGISIPAAPLAVRMLMRPVGAFVRAGGMLMRPRGVPARRLLVAFLVIVGGLPVMMGRGLMMRRRLMM